MALNFTAHESFLWYAFPPCAFFFLLFFFYSGRKPCSVQTDLLPSDGRPKLTPIPPPPVHCAVTDDILPVVSLAGLTFCFRVAA